MRVGTKAPKGGDDERRPVHGAYEQWPGIKARPWGVYASFGWTENEQKKNNRRVPQILH